MVPIQTEIIVACGEHKTVFSAQRIRIRVFDQAAGPYLGVEGFDDDAEADTGDGGPHCFYLETEAAIDQFSALCKQILKQANEAAEMGSPTGILTTRWIACPCPMSFNLIEAKQ